MNGTVSIDSLIESFLIYNYILPFFHVRFGRLTCVIIYQGLGKDNFAFKKCWCIKIFILPVYLNTLDVYITQHRSLESVDVYSLPEEEH